MFNYVDNIHFVAKQLDFYYGASREWPWRLCADLVGVSVATVRKYYSLKWDLNIDEKNIVNGIYKNIDFNKKEIKLLTPTEYNYFLDKDNVEIISKKKINKDLQKEQERIIFPAKHPIIHKCRYTWTEKGGVYLLCQITCPCDRPNEKYFLVKVGKSTNLNRRISSYRGSNPFAHCIDIQETRNLHNVEKKYHQRMKQKWEQQAGTEWFVVSEEDYKEILQKGFAAL